MSDVDLVVLGLGPAGRALAHRAARAGLRVQAHDPHPDRITPHTLSCWVDRLPAWLKTGVPSDATPNRGAPDDGVLAARCAPSLRTPAGTHALGRDYGVLDNRALFEALPLDGVRVEVGRAEPAELAARHPSMAVIDARGGWPDGPRTGTPEQTAHGVVLDADQVEPALDGADALLMDWTPPDGAPRWGRSGVFEPGEPRVATFCYVIPVAPGRMLVEETALAARPAVTGQVLRRRLATRLERWGLDPGVADRPPVERVRIPLLPRGTAGAAWPAFGAAGAQLNPISGYSVGDALAVVDNWVDRLVRRRPLPGSAPARLTTVALAALLRLGPDSTAELFAGFGGLTAARQRAVLDSPSPAGRRVDAMARMWWSMSPVGRLDLVRATVGGLRGEGSLR